MKRIITTAACLLTISALASAQDQTNIVMIVVDDLGYADMSHTGIATDVSTPNIDALAEEGVRFILRIQWWDQALSASQRYIHRPNSTRRPNVRREREEECRRLYDRTIW